MKFLVIGDSCLDVFVYGEVDRLAPEAPVPVIVPLFQKQNLGMASNVAENLRALGAEVNLITNLEQIRKVRYVDSRYNQMIMRVDENDKCQRISVDFNDLKEYDAIVVSDYCKGFLLEEDIQKIIQVASCPVFLDTKKNLGDWCKDVDFIKKHIFPGGFIPSIDVMTSAISCHTDMKLFNLQDIGPHYAKTLHDWRVNFDAQWSDIKVFGYDEQFQRLWHYYLSYCEGAFIERVISTHHVVARKPRYQDAHDEIILNY